MGSKIYLCWYFLRLGLTSFGGPLAIIAQIQRDLVEERKLIPEKDFLQALALIKSLPGPVAIQVVAYWSYRLAGLGVAILASVLFVLPAFLMMVFLAMFYEQFRASPHLVVFLDGMQAGALILIMQAMYSLSKNYLTHLQFWVLFALAFAAIAFLHLLEPVVIILAGLVSILWPRIFRLPASGPGSRLHSWISLEIFWICAKAGGLAFGTGFAILPLLQSDFVDLHHWVTTKQFMDAIAFGQLTPGPISVAVTFVGYRIDGWIGAILATIGIYLPGVFNMVTWFPRAVGWFSRQKWMQAFLVGATAAIIAGILWALQSMATTTPWVYLIAPAAMLGASYFMRIPSWLLVILSGASAIVFQYAN